MDAVFPNSKIKKNKEETGPDNKKINVQLSRQFTSSN